MNKFESCEIGLRARVEGIRLHMGPFLTNSDLEFLVNDAFNVFLCVQLVLRELLHQLAMGPLDFPQLVQINDDLFQSDIKFLELF